MNLPLAKQTAAWLPIVMSLASLALVLGNVAAYGIVYHEDEGTPAHLFQLLMAGQLPLIAYFALKWLPRTPGPALVVLALQAAAAFAALMAVYFLT